MQLTVDPERLHYTCGIPVRAQLHGKWSAYDAAQLDRQSFLAWIASRDDMEGKAGLTWRNSILLALMGHEQLTREEQ